MYLNKLLKLLMIPLALALLSSCAAVGSSVKNSTGNIKAVKKEKPLPAQIDQAYLHYMNAYLAENNGDYQTAMNEYAASLTYDPDSAPLLTHIAKTLMKLGRLNEAQTSAELAVRKDPAYQPAYLFLGALYSSSGKNDKAAAEYKKSIELDPGQEDPYVYLSILYATEGNSPKALDTLQTLTKRNPRIRHGVLLHGQGIFRHEGVRQGDRVVPEGGGFKAGVGDGPDQHSHSL